MDSINREILRLSIPTIISNITIPLLGICDTAISGHLGSELFLAAIAVGSVMLNVVYWIFGFLRGGTTGLTSNALGAGDEVETGKVLYRSLLIAGVAGIALISLQKPVFRMLWHIAGGLEEIRNLVDTYFSIRIWGSPALLSIIAISGWFVGMQNTFYPMLIAITTNVINIGCSFVLTFGLGYGFSGVPSGTLIADWTGLLIAIGCLLYFKRGRWIKCRWRILLKGEWLRYFTVNINLFLRSLFIICVTMGVTAAGARISNLTLAVNVIVMQFFQFFSFFMDGFAYSGEAMIGLRAGEGNIGMLKKCATRLLQWTLCTGLIFSIGYFISLEGLTGLITDSVPVIEGVADLGPWIALIPIVSCWAFIYDGFYIGITYTFQMMFSTLIGGLLFFGILAMRDTESWINGNYLIWTAFLTYLGIRGVYLWGLWPRSLQKLSREKFKNAT